MARLSWATILVTYALIVVGGIVRVSGSGLGCPDWPTCHGNWIPPFEFTALIEYSHRFLAAITSLLIAGLAAFTWLRHRRHRWLVALTTAGVVLLIVQILLGAVTVLLELPPTVVALHLGTALAILATSIVALVYAKVSPGPLAGRAVLHVDRFAALALTTAGAMYVLILSGAYVTGAGASLACSDWPLCNGDLVPSLSAHPLVWIHFGHRVIVLGVTVLVITLQREAWRVRYDRPSVWPASIALGNLFVLQVLVGAVNVWTRLDQTVIGVHLAVAAAIWALTVTVAAFACFHPAPVDRPASAEPYRPASARELTA